MSRSDTEEYNLLTQKGSSPNYAKQKRPYKHIRNELYITKTLYDPMDTISKNRRRKILADRSDGFCLNVPYSMNKKERWEKIDGTTVLKNRQQPAADALETLVVNRVDVPFSDDGHGNTVKSIKLIQNDGISTLASGGRRKTLSQFNNQIRDLRHMDKKEVDPAKLLFNFCTANQYHAQQTKRKSKQKKRRRAFQKSSWSDYGVYEELESLDCEVYASEEEHSVNERDSLSFDNKYSESSLGSFSDLGLDEYLTLAKQEAVQPNEICAQSLCKAKDTSVPSQKASTTLDSKDNPAGTIFEVIENPLKHFKPFSIEENILPFIRKELLKKWLDPKRLFVCSLELSHPKFVIFFEEDSSQDLLRVRVSTDTPYTPAASRSRLIDIVKTKRRRNLCSLFKDLYDFIAETKLEWKVEIYNNYDWNCRLITYPEGYRCRVNSKTIAPIAASSFEFEQINLLKKFYDQINTKSDHSITDCNSVTVLRCCCYRREGKSDLFYLSKRMMCRQCVSTSIINQLNRKKFPVEIPKFAPSSPCQLEVLYAILPIPTVASLLKESLAFQARPRFEMRFIICPNCIKPHEFCPMPLATTESCVFNSCSCSKCHYAFCYLCEWEPHWPMSCEQFERWSSKWDTQHVYEDYHIDGEQVRLCCVCEEIYTVPKRAIGRSCPRDCYKHQWRPPFAQLHDHTSDTDYNWSSLSIRSYKHLNALGIKIENCKICGHEILPESVEIKPVMNRKVAEICAYARRQRFLQNSDFEKFVMSSVTKNKEKFKDLRKTVLYLIEFCTGWIYVAKPPNWRHLSLKISNLNNSLQFIEQQLPLPREDFVKQVGKLEEETKNLIKLVRRSLNQRQV
ncbi:unnamed protein product [Cylicocyclus nassatus]|uniref:Uncharacterized protein n=1 Tax=Cylicocyclus nassatus TaxID=53992 RepID=A0AA36H0T5_CYLNA|nr:unnamed protein product [Cylicocyclus nassatus]